MGLVQNNIEESIEEFNNSQIIELVEFNDSLKEYSEAINRLFYLYIQNCVHRGDPIELQQSEVYCVLSIVEFLPKLKYQKTIRNTSEN